ncbi:MAG: LPS export ABC transporter periplasmic protein LptC [Nitrospirae bacterium]|nr:LPS export ABC transporter periplasmic protein LptC [Nitrospirota bacterium]
MKRIVFLLVFICFFIVIVFFSEREGFYKPKVNMDGNSYMDGVSIIQRKDGVVKWTLGSKKAIFLDDNNVKLVALQITFPEKGLTLNSDGGLYDIDKRNLKIDGHINASTADYDILTPTLYWDASKNELFSDQKVQIIGKKFYVEGDDLNSTNDKATLNKNVKAIFYYEKK